jgi:hypothetical protein
MGKKESIPNCLKNKHENEEWVFLDQVATSLHLVKTAS